MTVSVIIVYKQGDLVKYIVLASITFAPYFDYVTLDYLYMFHKTMNTFMRGRLTPGGVLYDLLIHVMSCYEAFSSEGKHRNIFLTCKKAVVS